MSDKKTKLLKTILGIKKIETSFDDDEVKYFSSSSIYNSPDPKDIPYPNFDDCETIELFVKPNIGRVFTS